MSPLAGILLCAVGGLQAESARRVGEVYSLEPSDPALALASLDRALALAPTDPEALKAALYLRLRLRDLAGAEEAGRALVESGKADAFAWIWLGNVAFWKRDLDLADRRYREAIARASPGPAQEDARAKLVQVEEERAYRARAKGLVRRALAAAGAAAILFAGTCAYLLRSVTSRRRSLRVE